MKLKQIFNKLLTWSYFVRFLDERVHQFDDCEHFFHLMVERDYVCIYLLENILQSGSEFRMPFICIRDARFFGRQFLFFQLWPNVCSCATFNFCFEVLQQFLWYLKALCIVIKLHNMFTSPIENCLDCRSIIHKMDPCVTRRILFLASLEYSRSARISSLTPLRASIWKYCKQ